MAQPSIQHLKSKKAENFEHNTPKQDNQDVENNQPGISKNEAPCSDVSDKLCDEPDPAVETEKQALKGEFQDKNSLPSTSKISDIPDMEFEEMHAYVDGMNISGEGNSSSTYEPDKVYAEHHVYVEHTPEDVNEGEEKNLASSSSMDVPDKVCEERHEYVDRSPEGVAELEENNSGSSSSSNAPLNELQEPRSFVDRENKVLGKTEIKIQLPEELKQYLIEDWNLVCRQKKLVILPEKHNLTNIFTSYLNYKCETSSVNWQSGGAREMLSGLEIYFTTVLNTQLLYDIERLQYNDIRSNYENEPVQRIYGGIHLLRLFVKLGPLLSYSPDMTEEDTVRRLTFYFKELLQYLLVKKSEYFGLEHYENASEEYLRRVQ
ncbi:MORF-related gene 15 [Carabus blaptoides fortunei]